MKKGKQALYGTKHVAAILEIPEWRVKNFSEGEAYRLPPSMRTGTGRGSRRLYRREDVLRIAIAERLVAFGFTPEAVGNGILEVRESELRSALSGETDERRHLPAGPEDEPSFQLVCEGGSWKVHKDEEWRLPSSGHGGVFVLDLDGVAERVYHALEEYSPWVPISSIRRKGGKR